MEKIRTRAIYKAATGNRKRSWFINKELVPSEQDRKVLRKLGFHFFKRVQ